MASTISMGQYLFKRAAELGIEHVFGVPGDFNRKSYLPIFLQIDTDILKSHFWTNCSRFKNLTGWEYATSLTVLMLPMAMQESREFQVS